MKQKRSTAVKKPTPIELDTDVIADLEAMETDTDAIRGGGRGSSGCRVAESP